LHDVERSGREGTKRDAPPVRAKWPPDLLRGTSAIRRGRARLDGANGCCNATISRTRRKESRGAAVSAEALIPGSLFGLLSKGHMPEVDCGRIRQQVLRH